MRTKSCLVSVYGSGNILAAIAAVRWHRQQNCPEADLRVVTVVHPPTSSETAQKNGAVIDRVLLAQGWPAGVLLTDDDVTDVLNAGRLASYGRILSRFRQAVGDGPFDEVYYCHDITGRVPELALNAYPDAKRILYGDALGSVYDKRAVLASVRELTDPADGVSEATSPPPAPGELHTLLRHVRSAILGGPRELHPQDAVLILPMDQTGHVLDGTTLSVVPRSLLLDIIARSQAAVPELVEYSQEFLSSTPAPHHLVLLENFSDGRMMSPEEEVAMYETVVRENAPLGSTVLIKAHPLASAQSDDVLRNRLEGDYTVRLVPRDLGRFPIELWSDLARACRVLSVFSYCSISLSFLYGTPTFVPDDAFIERFFPSYAQKRARESARAWNGQLDNLATWDGKSILWKGTA